MLRFYQILVTFVIESLEVAERFLICFLFLFLVMPRFVYTLQSFLFRSFVISGYSITITFNCLKVCYAPRFELIS